MDAMRNSKGDPRKRFPTDFDEEFFDFDSMDESYYYSMMDDLAFGGKSKDKKMTDKFNQFFGKKSRVVEIKPQRLEMTLYPKVKPVTVEFMMKHLFRQWTSTLFRLHTCEKVVIPENAFAVMQDIFNANLEISSLAIPADLGDSDIISEQMETSPAGSTPSSAGSTPSPTAGDLKIQAVKDRKDKKTIQQDCMALLKTCHNVIWKDNNYKEDIKVVEETLKTTVKSKYDDKLLHFKGHGTPEWNRDMKEFFKIYNDNKAMLDALPEPTPADCCRVTMTSFLSALKGNNAREMMREEKATFLKEMPFTGIPVYAPVRDSAQINPWTLYLKNICRSPYEILSQTAMEEFLEAEMRSRPTKDKQITLSPGDSTSTLNIIVPIVPYEHARALKPFVRSSIFAAACTFCILKNALINDFTCHLAALACVWMKTIRDFPVDKRPEYIVNRIRDIEETAKLYLDRERVKSYVSCLWQKPKLAVCTDATQTFESNYIKCESLVKPAFLVQISRFDLPLVWKFQNNLHLIVQEVLQEFIGRCLQNYESKTPFIDFYLPSLETKKRTSWINEKALVSIVIQLD